MPYPNDRERCACRCGESIEGRADVVEFRGEVYITGHEPTSEELARCANKRMDEAEEREEQKEMDEQLRDDFYREHAQKDTDFL